MPTHSTKYPSRLTCAVHIRDCVLADMSEHGVWWPYGEGKARIVDTAGYHARMHGPFNPHSSFPRKYDRFGDEVRDASHGWNLLSAWLQGGPKVLTLAWRENENRLISMKRGHWEHRLFQLPTPQRPSITDGPIIHRQRSRRMVFTSTFDS